jgi:hypothetical protein
VRQHPVQPARQPPVQPPEQEHARTTFALIRSVLIRAWQLRSEEGNPAAPPAAETTLIDQAFAAMRRPPA